MGETYDFTDEELSKLQEADVDTVLVEALCEVPDFVRWIVQKTFGEGIDPVRLADVAPNQFMGELGETDVQLLVKARLDQTLAVLIENKVRAPSAGPVGGVDQDDRYLLRGERGRSEGLWNDFRTCLCAPQKYLDSRAPRSSYQCTLSHERLQEWFDQSDHPRAGEWAWVIAASIESCRRGYVAIIDEDAHSFSMDYWNYLRDHHPDVQMSKPKDTPEGGSWKYLKFPGMPAGVHVVHKFHRSDRNSMDLSFFGAMTVADLQQSYGPLLDESMEIHAAGRSAVVGIRTP